jgi:hypothetical protein
LPHTRIIFISGDIKNKSGVNVTKGSIENNELKGSWQKSPHQGKEKKGK